MYKYKVTDLLDNKTKTYSELHLALAELKLNNADYNWAVMCMSIGGWCVAKGYHIKRELDFKGVL